MSEKITHTIEGRDYTFSTRTPIHDALQRAIRQQRSMEDSKDVVLRVERIAYREHEHAQWNWYGPVIRFMASGHASNWLVNHVEIEKLCMALREKYLTVEDYVINVKCVYAPDEKALDLVQMNEVAQ